jgi:hypothetical protein
VPPEAMMQVLGIMTAIHNFISGESFFRPMMSLKKEEYIKIVKSTLKFLFIPAFTKKK